MRHVGTRHAQPAYLEAFRTIVSRIEQSLKSAGPKLKEPVRMYVAGGAALHFYTGSRISEDIDATFSKRVILPKDLEIAYRDEQGAPRLLYFDRQYNDTMGLLHENADLDSIPLELEGIDRKVIEVRLLSPVDLAVSKLSRFEAQDQDDIRSLAQAGLLDLAQFRDRAEQALGAYVGAAGRVQLSIKLACKIISQAIAHEPPSPRAKRR
jgi:hypothetical protein